MDEKLVYTKPTYTRGRGRDVLGIRVDRVRHSSFYRHDLCLQPVPGSRPRSPEAYHRHILPGEDTVVPLRGTNGGLKGLVRGETLGYAHGQRSGPPSRREERRRGDPLLTQGFGLSLSRSGETPVTSILGRRTVGRGR